MTRFAQHTRLVSTPGNVDALVGKFLEAAEMQRENPACEAMIASRSIDDDDVVYLTEIWSSEEDWDRARRSDRIAEWAKDMPALVASAPQSVQFIPIGGKGVARGD